MKSPRIVQLAMFAMVVFGSVETAFADISYSFTTIDVPGAFYTEASGINDSGQIVGAYGNTPFYPPVYGFLEISGAFTGIDFPGVSSTFADGINDSGQIVGRLGDATGAHGFLDTGGSFTSIDSGMVISAPAATRSFIYGTSPLFAAKKNGVAPKRSLLCIRPEP